MENVNTIRTIVTVLVFISSASITISYLLQSPKASGLGAISGNATVYKSRRPLDLFLDKLILWSGILFGLSTLVLAVLKTA
ncbi:MAG: preprotein translocase subunit SecG [Caldisericia bacterium]|nr:preprotein translocase subunit SecG [Caldisericia bacterium]